MLHAGFLFLFSMLVLRMLTDRIIVNGYEFDKAWTLML